MTFSQKINYTTHCGSQIHKVKCYGDLPYDELGDVSEIVAAWQYKQKGLEEMRTKFIDHYIDRNCAFMTSLQSEIVHVFRDTWREMPVKEFIDFLDELVTKALKNSGICQCELQWILKLGHTKNEEVTKPHAYWIKKELIRNFKWVKNDVPKVFAPQKREPEEAKDESELQVEEPPAAPEERPAASEPPAAPEEPPAAPEEPEKVKLLAEYVEKKVSTKKPKVVPSPTQNPTLTRLLAQKEALEKEIAAVKPDKLAEFELLCKNAVKKCRIDYFGDFDWSGLEEDDPEELAEETEQIKPKYKMYAEMINEDEDDPNLVDRLNFVIKQIKKQ